MFLSSKFSSFKIVLFLSTIFIIINLYYFAVYKANWFKYLFSSLTSFQTNLYLISLFFSIICFITFTIYIYKKPEPNTPVLNMPMETEGQFYYLILFSIILLSSILFTPFIFNYAFSSNIDVSYIIKALSYLILFATIGLILLFNNTQFSLKTKKEKKNHIIIWITLFYFFIQISFIDIAFWIPKFLQK